MLQPEIMVPPLLWLVSDAAAGVNGRRFIAADWDAALPPEQAAEKAGRADRLAGDRADADRAGVTGAGNTFSVRAIFCLRG